MLEFQFLKRFLLSPRAGSLVRTIAWLSIVSVAIGVTSLIVVVSVMNGFHESIRKRLLAAEPHLILSLEKRPVVGLGLHPGLESRLLRIGAEMDLIDRQDVVIRTSEGVFSGAEARGLEMTALKRLLRAVDEASSMQSIGEEIPEISMISAELMPGEIMLGAELARGLGLFEGDKITVIAPEALLLPPGEVPRFERVVIKRLLTTNVADLDGKLFIYGRGKSLNGLGASASRRTDVEIWLPFAEKARELKAEIVSAAWDLTSQSVQTWEDRNSALFQALRLEIFSIGLFLSLSTMIAGFSIVTVLLILITQKRKEIGLLMSLGLSRAKTRALFTRLGILLSSVGILTGTVLGVVTCLLIDSLDTSILPEFYYDTTIPAKLNLWFVAAVVSLAMFLAFLASYIPSKRITEMEPADALRSRLTARLSEAR
jgi:lipoprotein-releasing system permease protein